MKKNNVQVDLFGKTAKGGSAKVFPVRGEDNKGS